MTSNESAQERSCDYGAPWGAGSSRWYAIDDSDGKIRLVPRSVQCPISCHPIEDPVVTCDGQLYDRSQIEKWFKARTKKKLPITSPCTGCELKSKVRLPCEIFRAAFESFIVDSGFEERYDKLRKNELELRDALSASQQKTTSLEEEIRELKRNTRRLRSENARMQQQLQEQGSINAVATLRQVETRTHRALTTFFRGMAPVEGQKKRKAVDALSSEDMDVVEISGVEAAILVPAPPGNVQEALPASGTTTSPAETANRRNTATVASHGFQLPSIRSPGSNLPLCSLGTPRSTTHPAPLQFQWDLVGPSPTSGFCPESGLGPAFGSAFGPGAALWGLSNNKKSRPPEPSNSATLPLNYLLGRDERGAGSSSTIGQQALTVTIDVEEAEAAIL
mmetsp:Transcript_51699/g.109820  ORF Transcript_51699/g.109820 Transcript_51699/m.109820 type:complete len:392 (-) Transcript_51699:96-1271(-)